MTDAPFHHEIAFGPSNAHAIWRTASDGVRLRIGFWPLSSAKGTVLMFPGRTEYIEKYGHVAEHFAQHGWAMASIDWRGQGLSDRLMDDPWRGHVGKFRDYQKDVAELIGAARAQGLPEPYMLIAHSMGGAIALRALMDGLSVKAAVFSAPMWGILMSPSLRPAAWALSRLVRVVGAGTMLAPGTKPRSFITQDPFEDNTLTRDADMWSRMGDQIKAVPGLELGGPSLDWVREAVSECAALDKMPSPAVPCLTFLGSNERIVDTASIHRRMGKWPGGTLRMVQDGEHEVLMETPAKRLDVLNEITAYFELSAAADAA